MPLGRLAVGLPLLHRGFAGIEKSNCVRYYVHIGR
jgi:hypothetical protein